MKIFLTFSFLLFAIFSFSQTYLQGTVTDADSGEPIIFGTVAIYKNGLLLTGTETDFDGFYSVELSEGGIYEVEFSYTGYGNFRANNVVVVEGKANRLDRKMKVGIINECCFGCGFRRPLIKQDDTTQGFILTAEEIRRMPHRGL